ncbi:MAG TPA: hydantoinase B/oxoprolinase family protein [Polyangiaceae bacterium]|nr:hydantoinase B/oxoprolinase family protein [Polyangiaceae bacterium]
MLDAARWQFAVDRGGTFTDCIGRDPGSGSLSVVKVPSSDDAPLVGIRLLLGLPPDAPIPPCEVRLGTTLGTNALLERRGARSALLLTRGFGDLLELSDQTRPDLFALEIKRPGPLPELVLEVHARLDADGEPLERPDPAQLERELERLRQTGCDSVGIAVLNDYRAGLLEADVADLARRAGFTYVATGHQVAPSIGYLARASTVALDAYLTPLLQRYLERLTAELPDSRLLLMQSSGGLCQRERFRGAASVLSGPAGGAEALAAVARAAGLRHAVGFDMGGTSTDVTRVEHGELSRVYESQVGGTHIAAPIVAVHTVAAGGGSVCRFDGERLRVGPESVGAVPGPLCYGRPGPGELSLTDVNLALGRVIADRFPLPLSLEPALAALEKLRLEVASAGHDYGALDVAEGLFRIANANMAEAIREVTVARGFDLREHALVVFGGAGGQHACALARELGVQQVLFHPLAGVLSAWGIGISRLRWEGRADAGGRLLSDESLAELAPEFDRLLNEGRAALARDGADAAKLAPTLTARLRYRGTETELAVPFPSGAAAARAEFEAQFRARFGYLHQSRPLEIAQISVALAEPAAVPTPQPAVAAASALPEPTRRSRLYVDGQWLENVPVYLRETLTPGAVLTGPAIIAEATGTIVLDPAFSLSANADGLLRVTQQATTDCQLPTANCQLSSPDPVLLEIYANRFMSIAEQMGRTLRQTAMSVNIRERLDFSCAVFDAQGELIANAPHIPVHLGAMSESVKAVLRAHADLAPGDLFVTNDPTQGGSHLPDVTVVAPVHDAGGALRFFAAARGHHADIGGKTPGSMPAFSHSLAEEGIVLRNVRIGRAGHFDRDHVRDLLSAGPHPARRVPENLADLEAQLAAVRTGASLLLQLADERGVEEVERYMRFVQDNAASEVRRAIASLEPGRHTFSDQLDDGTPLVVTLSVDDAAQRLTVDFSGTGAEHPGNLNAPRAVTLACVLYFLRVLVGKPIPLNSGCLRHVELVIPERSLLSPGPHCAVAGGNVETSQRVVDVLFGAAGLLAGSQGTMNNLSFGDGSYGYYETIAGGAGAGSGFAGASAVHTHMTNTRITDAEVIERRFPVRVVEHAVRRSSGGVGQTRGGDGVRRTLEFRAPAQVSILSEHRASAPRGLFGGGPAQPGQNLLNGRDLGGAVSLEVKAGDRLTLLTPGGGGFGPAALGTTARS